MDRSAQTGGRLSAPIIREIQIFRNNVFAHGRHDDERVPTFVKRLVNRLHRVTEERVVRRELLFKEGDRLDPALLLESERNLRKLGFLGEAEIRPEDRTDGDARVLVETQDRWSTLLATNFEGAGGLSRFGLMVGDYNLLGQGQTLVLLGSIGTERNDLGFRFWEPRLFSSRWTLETSARQASDGGEVYLQVERPLYSLSTKWAFRFSFRGLKLDTRLYRDGIAVVKFPHEELKLKTTLTRSLGGTVKKRVAFQYETENLRNVPEGSREELVARLQGLGLAWKEVFRERRRNLVALSFGVERPQYGKATFLDNYGNVEDITTGWQIATALGGVWETPAAEPKRAHVGLAGRTVKLWARQHYFGLGFEVTTDATGHRLRNTVGVGKLVYYNLSLPRQTWATQLTVVLGLSLPADEQILLGGSTGLRGYKAYQFSGDRSALLNLENRIHLGELLTIGVGLVPFADVGRAWTGDRLRWKDLRASAGLGLRFGFGKFYNAQVARIDLAYPLDGTGSPMISFGTGQHFSFMNILR